MRNYLIADRYAKALSGSIPDDGELDEARDALRQLSESFAASHDLRSVLTNPVIDTNKRAAILEGVITSDKVPPADAPRVVKSLVRVLLRRGRIAMLPDVVEVFSVLVDERLGRVSAVATTTAQLDDAQENRLRGVLDKYSGKSVRMKFKIDPEILGGVVVRMGDTIIDGSVRTQLEGLRHALLSEEK